LSNLDLKLPNVPISCLPPSRVDPEVQGLKVIIDCPQPGSSQATYRPPPVANWPAEFRKICQRKLRSLENSAQLL